MRKIVTQSIGMDAREREREMRWWENMSIGDWKI